VVLAGNQFRVTPQLIDVGSGRTLWQHTFEGQLEVAGQVLDLWVIVDAIATRIVAELLPELTPEVAARGPRTRDLQALQLYSSAMQAIREDKSTSSGRAIQLLEQALAHDSSFADAWAALAVARGQHNLWIKTVPGELAVADWRAAQRAIDLDSLNGRAYRVRGWLQALYLWDWDGARRDMQQAVRLAPADAGNFQHYAAFLHRVGEHDSALAVMRHAVALDPTHSVNWSSLAGRFLFAGRSDSVVAAAEHALSLDSANSDAYAILMHQYLDDKRPGDAARAARRLIDLAGAIRSAVFLAAYYRRAGDRAGAQKLLALLTSAPDSEYVSPTAIGAARLALGDRAGALDALDRAMTEKDRDLPGTLMSWLAPLEGDPRFEAMRRRVFGNRRLARSPVP
jgi:tetratricopeptide (TPR) repeat protein